MSSGFSKSDLDSLFDTDGVGVAGRIFTADENGDPAMTEDEPPVPVFLRELNVIFTIGGQDVPVYNETDVATEQPSFLCKTTDLAGVKKGMRFEMPNLESHEDGYGKSYQVTSRILREDSQASRVYLKEL